MEAPETKSVYRPLNVKKGEIRLLELLPFTTNNLGLSTASKPVVRFKYQTLDSHDPYEALSYTWGDPRKRDTVQVESDTNFVVRANLASALQDLQLPTEARLIWIDALSINQKDTAERSEQVKLMRSIYETAAVVRSWIDLEIDLQSPAFLKLHSLSDDAAVKDLGNDATLWSPVREVLTNEYWSRIWVQQEVAYAKEWTVQCRRTAVSSAALMIFATLLVLRMWGFFTDPLVDKSAWKSIMPTPLRALLYRSKPHDSAQSFYGPLTRALRDCRLLQSTDARDKIYAMLGMVDGLEDGDIDVNYELSAEQVYIEVARLCIERYESVAFLCEASLENTAKERSLPSWLPDWTQLPRIESFVPLSSKTSYQPITSPVRSEVPAIYSRKLHVTGFRIDKVHDLLPEIQEEALWHGELDLRRLIVKFRSFNAVKDAVEAFDELDVETLAYFRDSYLVRVLTGADSRDTEPPRFERYVTLFATLLEASSLEEDEALRSFSAIINAHPDDVGDVVHYMQESCKGRCFSFTSDCDMALVPEPAQVGDEIWIVFGCPAPVTLRCTGDEYLVIGEAYLNDVTNGEAMEGMPEFVKAGEEHGRYEIRRIVLC